MLFRLPSDFNLVQVEQDPYLEMKPFCKLMLGLSVQASICLSTASLEQTVSLLQSDVLVRQCTKEAVYQILD